MAPASGQNWRALYAQKSTQGAGTTTGYSQFIRRARLILPIFATVMIVIVVLLSGEETIETEPIERAEQPVISGKIGKNELLKPKFESKDREGRPYTITADRAFQGSGNENLLILENPLADLKLNETNYLMARAQKAGYRQDTQRLFLNGDVQVVHDEGLHLLSEELHVNLDQNLVWSDIEVEIQGPQGMLSAQGMNGNANLSVLTFKGPASLTITDLNGSLGSLGGAL